MQYLTLNPIVKLYAKSFCMRMQDVNGHVGETDKALLQGSHIYWKNIIHLENLEKSWNLQKIIKIMEISWNFVSLEMWESWDTVEMIYFCLGEIFM